MVDSDNSADFFDAVDDCNEEQSITMEESKG